MFNSRLRRRLAGALIALSIIGAAPARGAVDVRVTRHERLLTTPQTARRSLAAVVPSNITTADPAVPRPDTKPCVVPLFRNVAFADFSPKPFAYVPPAACPGSWSKIVLSVNLALTPGVQFDRTATIGLGGATIFFGTTAEPFANAGPAWNVQRDLTDLAALFRAPHAGQVSIGNLVNSTYTSVISGSAQLFIYPADAKYPAPRTADTVIPLADVNGNPVALATTASLLATSFVPPTNVEAAQLDVIAQSQSNDEFWYTCVPNDLTKLLQSCGNSAFRETDAFVDRRPAGVAPVYPWIYTGGIDPFLWAPTPGVQTLNFVPYRVDLTPFAAALDNGRPHTVALSVFNADSYFAVTANLLLFLDHGAKGPLSGGVDVDTLAAVPPLTVSQTGAFDPSGSLLTASKRKYEIEGHVNTSHGTVHTRVDGAIDFAQNAKFTVSGAQYVQDIAQDEQISVTTATSGAQQGSVRQEFDFPLLLDIEASSNADGSSQQTTQVRQGYLAQTFASAAHPPAAWTFVADSVAAQDTLHFDPAGNFSGNTGTASSQVYRSFTPDGGCYGKTVVSKNLVVTRVATIPCGCKR